MGGTDGGESCKALVFARVDTQPLLAHAHTPLIAHTHTHTHTD